MLGSVTWDEALVQRYGQFGQLHCSYPAAVDFSDRVAPLDLLRALRESRARRTAALPLHSSAGRRWPAARGRGGLPAAARTRDRAARLSRRATAGGRTAAPERRHPRYRGAAPPAHQLKRRFAFVEPHAGSFLAEVELAHVDWPLIGALHELGFNQLSVAVPDLRADDGGTVEYFRSSARIRAVIEAAHALHYRSVNLTSATVAPGRPRRASPGSWLRSSSSRPIRSPCSITVTPCRPLSAASASRRRPTPWRCTGTGWSS